MVKNRIGDEVSGSAGGMPEGLRRQLVERIGHPDWWVIYMTRGLSPAMLVRQIAFGEYLRDRLEEFEDADDFGIRIATAQVGEHEVSVLFVRRCECDLVHLREFFGEGVPDGVGDNMFVVGPVAVALMVLADLALNGIGRDIVKPVEHN